jgi:hypothetical protein
MNTETLTAFVAGMTATIIICGLLRVYRIMRPVQDDIDWERGQ